MSNNLIKIWAKKLNRHFFIQDIQMANWYSKRCSTSFVIREMQTKTTTRHHLTLVGKAMMRKTSPSWCGSVA